ncbi:MAG: HD domain-containing protein [bacterium]
MIDEKIIRDPIYGYVPIPAEYCKNFIDTKIFQRLRRIEQTSMRVLYPSAHHDRFAHSIGVFYLGHFAFTSLKNNSHKIFEGIIDSEKWEFYKKTFEIACLMHDCGHSPFSHTFEHYYLYKKEDEIKSRISLFYEDCNDFSDEYDSASPAEHEKISALLLLEEFSEKMSSMEASPELAARMIMGMKHETNLSLIKKFENKLITLLNGSGIDVDSLDYIQRDSWASGVSNVNIDYQRLLSAIMIKPDENDNVNIVFKKKVLSVIDNISIGRNFLYKWIYSHHKVIYEQDLLTKIIESINSNSELSTKVFSIEAFKEAQEFEGQKYYLPTDDDIIHMIKQHESEDSKIGEFLSRDFKYKALWKTYFEFNESHFVKVSDINRMSIATKIEKGALDKKYGKGNILCIKAKPKLKSINENDFFIEIDKKLIDASKATSQINKNLSYFIVYVTENLRSKKDDIIKDILALQS